MKEQLRVEGNRCIITMVPIKGPLKGQGYEAYTDAGSFERLCKWPLLFSYKESTSGTAKAPTPRRMVASQLGGFGEPYKRIGLHNLIFNGPLGCLVDHIDRQPMNNCFENLRRATPRLNGLNRSNIEMSKERLCAIAQEVAIAAALPVEGPNTWDHWEEVLGIGRPVYIIMPTLAEAPAAA